MPSRRPTARRSRPYLRGAVLLTAVLALAGCGLRLETPPPAPPVPDAVETVRQRTTADAVALTVLAHASAPADEQVAALLEQVAITSEQHLTALGGVYSPGRTPTPTAAPSAAPTPSATSVDAVVGLLVDASERAWDDADAVDDGRLARVLASTAVSRRLLAERLAASAGLPADAVAPAPVAEHPGTVPPGVDARELSVLVASHDAAGATWEVVAARSGGDVRTDAATRAATHRSAADDWARTADLHDGTDPREVAYDLPDAVVEGQDAAAVRAALSELETSVAATAATLVATADPQARGPFLSTLLDAARTASAGGTAVPALPGLPEQA